MSYAVQEQTAHTQRFTTTEQETDIADGAIVARTKRYTFYWLLCEEPLLVRVTDYDGTDVTDEVEPPDGMEELLAQAG